LRNLRGFASRRCSGADNGDDELAYTHTSGPIEQQATPSELLDHVKGSWSGDHVDDVHDCRDQEWVLKADLLEERGAIVN